jgi:tetratricopeptide (TPR) repeat protein
MKPVQAEDSTELAVDPENPWLGLSSYSEETRAYFHGRDDETAELARRVQRKLLTVLFGQSGLGKTSLLRAGLVPRLRPEAYCPVYVRVDYSADSPSPSEQIKRAIFRATAAAGHWTRPGSAVEGESLWEFLHHRGDLLRDADGRTLLPLLIFDQFEEIFTLGQADDAGRQRAKLFLADLADLVENRPPAALEERLDRDETDAEQYDFARADYRILIALREDYLAHLESVKDIMPSITQNRMRLARMTGAQALSAVVKPGGRLVSEEVAESIVRFVAGGSELATAEVEPSLLSLVCRELNTARLARGGAEISADLLAGTRDTILTEFYERALADQPDGVRRVIEDELLTESGYRESLAEERVLKALAAAGAAPDALAKLVDRRLLRIEERLDLRRVELTHDVLCGIVRSSRDVRHAREARDEAERQLARQREREAETHRTLVRTRKFAAVCAVLMLVAAASAVFGWVNMRRARAADAEAQNSRLLAEGARSDAEKLVGFLIDDFYDELEPTGRLETMGKLAHMAVSYYDSLPAELVTPRTEMYRAMAIVREGSAQGARGDVAAATRSFDAAQKVFERLHAADPGNEDTLIGLALTLFSRFNLAFLIGNRGDTEGLARAADLLRPLAHAPDGSSRARILYADTLNFLSHTQPLDQRLATCNDARKVLVATGALDMSNLRAASVYADVSDSAARHALLLGRPDEAEKLERETYDVAEKVLERRPGDLRSMANRALASEFLGRLAQRRYDFTTALARADRAAQAGEDYVRFNPSDLTAWQYLVRGREQQAEYLIETGRINRALATLRATVALEGDARRPSSLAPSLLTAWFTLEDLEARLGQRDASERSLNKAAAAVDETLLTIDVRRKPLTLAFSRLGRARQAFHFGDFRTATPAAVAVVRDLDGPSQPKGATPTLQMLHGLALANALQLAAAASLHSGDAREAEVLARRRAGMLSESMTAAQDPRIEAMRARTILAQSLVLQDRRAEARTELEPVLKFYESVERTGARNLTFVRDYARALAARALASDANAGDKAKVDASLAKATALLNSLPTETRALSDVRNVTALIADARRGSAG